MFFLIHMLCDGRGLKVCLSRLDSLRLDLFVMTDLEILVDNLIYHRLCILNMTPLLTQLIHLILQPGIFLPQIRQLLVILTQEALLRSEQIIDSRDASRQKFAAPVLLAEIF